MVSESLIIKIYTGIDSDPINEANDEYLEIKKIINQQTPNTKPKVKFKEKSIPTYVATPLPPLNFSHTGNTWPIKADKADI